MGILSQMSIQRDQAYMHRLPALGANVKDQAPQRSKLEYSAQALTRETLRVHADIQGCWGRINQVKNGHLI